MIKMPNHGDKKVINGKWHVWNSKAWLSTLGHTPIKGKDNTVTYPQKGIWTECVYNRGKWI